MKAFHSLIKLRGRVSFCRNVSRARPSNGLIKVFTPMLSRRYSSEIETVTWTPHSFKPSTTPSDEQLELPTPKPAPKHTAYIALGSNLGDRIGWIEKACNMMAERGIKLKRTSCLWETAPMYVTNQENFVNGACEVETELEPLALLDQLQDIENALGRKKIIDKGPRNIDLDILLYGEQTVDHDRLKIPHPGMYEREFVLQPLSELIPGRALDPASPWKVTQDYLNALEPSSPPLTTLTPLAPDMEPLRALQSNRKTHTMAIINVTPDSFSDGGRNYRNKSSNEVDYYARLLAKMEGFLDDGATILDIGGQTTAPNAKSVYSSEEMARVVPAIRLLIDRKPKNFAISIDTYRASVAEGAVNAGAHIINDVSAGQMDPEMLSTMARLGTTVSLMHMRGTPETMNHLTSYPEGLIPTIATELMQRVAEAEAAGIRRWRIILDPGIGFAKSGEQNLEILRRMDELRDWPGLRGLPWLLGSSRKRFIGTYTGVKKAEKRQWGTAATVTASVQGGADIVRVHDVQEMVQVVKMSDAIWRL